MKSTLVFVFASILFLTGCHDWVNQPIMHPPSAPTGLRTSPGDNFIELFWNKNTESSVAGYNVYVSSSYSGRYELVGTSSSPYFNDKGAKNGTTYYYAVTAYDIDGNESDLSKEEAYDIPRPEGYNLTLSDFNTAPLTSGYDFSSYTVVPYTDKGCDVYFDSDNGIQYLDVSTDSDIQDMGPTSSILDINTAPASGWSTTHDVRVTVGHTYIVWTWDDHYAKVRVSALSSGRVVLDWAYQTLKSSPLLKRAPSTMDQRPAVDGVRGHHVQ